MASLLRLSLDAKSLEDAVSALARLDPDTIVRLSVDSVNTVAQRVDEQAKQKIVGDVNLSQAYVDAAFTIKPADAGQKVPTARVATPRRNMTLARFGAQQMDQPVRWTNATIESLGHPFGQWPGWTRRTGDQLRGIQPDRKAAGASVEVKRGGRKGLKSAFFLPLRNGGGYQGLFVHEGGKLKHLYGPAVYQLYRNYIDAQGDDIQQDLQQVFLENLDAQLREVTP